MDNKIVLLVGLTAGIAAAVYLLYQELRKQRTQIREQNLQIRALLHQAKRVEGLIYTYNIDHIDGDNRNRQFSSHIFPAEESMRDMIHVWNDKNRSSTHRYGSIASEINAHDDPETSNSHSSDESSETNDDIIRSHPSHYPAQAHAQAHTQAHAQAHAQAHTQDPNFIGFRRPVLHLPQPFQRVPRTIPSHMYTPQPPQFNNTQPIDEIKTFDVSENDTDEELPTLTPSHPHTLTHIVSSSLAIQATNNNTNANEKEDDKGEREVDSEGECEENKDIDISVVDTDNSKKIKYYKDTPTNRKLNRVGQAYYV